MISGRLLDPSEAPATGERIEEVFRHRNLMVEQILSGDVDDPVDYLQEQDEWVVLTAGTAVMEVGGEAIELTAGDWVFLPGGVPHRLVRTTAGSRWLGVHLYRER